MKKLILLIAFCGLCACGADGEPVEPTAGIGVSVGSGGANVGASVGVRRGPLSIGVSLF